MKHFQYVTLSPSGRGTSARYRVFEGLRRPSYDGNDGNVVSGGGGIGVVAGTLHILT
jgi:hypothetical protein